MLVGDVCILSLSSASGGDLGISKGRVEVRQMHSGVSGWDKAVTLFTIVWPCCVHSAGNLAGEFQWTECLFLKSHMLEVGSR